MDKITKTIAEELNIKTTQVENTIKLIDEGNTIPFIARYRKEVTGGLSDEILRTFGERLTYLRNLETRKEEIVKSIDEQGKLTDEILQAVAIAKTLAEVEDIYRPYKQKKKTRATVAKSKGLEPLAKIIIEQKENRPILEIAKEYINIDNLSEEDKKNKEKVVATAEDAIQGALDIEINYFLSKMENKENKAIAGYEFYMGFIKDVKVIISKTLIGEINASTATTIGIINFKPDIIINQGIAGAYRENLHRGDIIIGEKCCNINAYKMPIKYEGEGSNPFEWELNKRAKDIKYGDIELVKLFEDELKNINKNKFYKGILGSGDAFNREYDRITWIRNIFNNDSEDMESIGCYSVCEKFNIPCIGIRIISNNELIHEEIDKENAIDLQKIIIDILNKIV